MVTPKYRILVVGNEANLNFTVADLRDAMESICSMVEVEILRGPLSIQVERLGSMQ